MRFRDLTVEIRLSYHMRIVWEEKQQKRTTLVDFLYGLAKGKKKRVDHNTFFKIQGRIFKYLRAYFLNQTLNGI